MSILRLTAPRRAILILAPLGALALAGVVEAGYATAATTPKPLILSIGASTSGGQPLAASGARVVVSVHVRNAKRCSFFAQHRPLSSLYLVRTVSCVSGHASVSTPPIANPYGKTVRLRFVVLVQGAGPRSVQRSVTVTEAGLVASQPAPTPTPTPAPPPTLQIVSVSVSPTTVPTSGGTVTVTVHAQGAVTCTFGGEDLTPLPLPCSSGSAAITLTLPANTGPTVTHTYYVTAQDVNGVVTPQRTYTVVQEGVPVPPYLAPYLDVCTPGQDCYYGPLSATYPDYGNVAPAGLGDCTFAAAADWEQIVHGASPDPTVIGYEFAAAGGTADGLTAQALFSYWIQQGIAGIRATGFTRYFTDQTSVENGVRDYGAMLVEFQFVAGTGFGQITIPNDSRHMAVVDGFTPEGPLVVTWGQTLQLTWDQWNAEVVDMYGVATS